MDVSIIRDGIKASVPAENLEQAKALGWAEDTEAGGERVESHQGENPPAGGGHDAMDAVESFGTGAAKFLTGGLTDAAAGVGAGAASGLEALTQGDDVLEKMKEGYKEGRNERRAYEEGQYEKNPLAYGAGGLVGGLVGAKGAGRALQGKTLPGTMLRNAGMGAAQGYSMSESDDAAGDLLSMLAGGAIGGALPLAGPALRQLKKIPGALKGAASGPVAQGLKKTAVESASDIPVVRKLARAKANIDEARAASAPATEEIPVTSAMIEDLGEGPVQASGLKLARPPKAPIEDLEQSLASIDDEMGLQRALSDEPQMSVEPTEDAPLELTQKKPAAEPDFDIDVVEPEAKPATSMPEALEQQMSDVDEVLARPAKAPLRKSAAEWGPHGPTAEKRAAIEAAIPGSLEKYGTIDLAEIHNRTGIPTSDLAKILPRIAAEYRGVAPPKQNFGSEREATRLAKMGRRAANLRAGFPYQR